MPHPGWFFWFPWREVRRHRWRSLLSALALGLSVGLLVATGSIGALMRASVATPGPLVGQPSDFWISSTYDSDYDLSADLATEVEAISGVAEVQPVLRRPIRVTTPRPDTLSLLGVELVDYFAFHDLSLSAGDLPSAASPGLVAPAPWAFVRELRIGDPITITTPKGNVTLPVAGLIKIENLAAAQQGLVLYAPLETVADLFGLQKTITLLEVRLASDTNVRRVQRTLEDRLGPAYAISAASRQGQEPQLWQRLVLGTLVFVDGLTMAGSMILVYAVFAAATKSRRRQVGLLRAAGAQQGQVLILLVGEAMILALAGSGLGLVLGFLFAWAGTHLLLPGSSLPPVPPVPAASTLLAVGLGILAGLAGALLPTLRAVQIAPLEALYTLPTRHYGPETVARLDRVLSPLGRRLPAEGGLALANLLRERRRAALITGAMAGILAMALGNVGVLSLLGEEMAASLGRLTGGDYLVLPALTTISLRELAGQDTSDVPPLDQGLLSALEALGNQAWLMPGTTANIETLQVFAGQPTLLLDIEGYAQMGGFRFLEGSWPDALATFRRGPALLLTRAVARRLGVGLADEVQLETQRGPVDFEVAGIGDSEFTTCVLDLADGMVYLGTNEINAVMVQIRPEADAKAVERALRDAIQTHGATLAPLGDVSTQLKGVFQQVRRSLGILIGLTGLVAGLGVVNATLSSLAERRREIGLLRAVGATKHQIERIVMVEMSILGGVAALLGTGLGWALTLLFLGMARAHLGLASAGMPSLAAWQPLLTATGAGLVFWPLLAVLGGLAPALHAARLPVLRSLYQGPPE